MAETDPAAARFAALVAFLRPGPVIGATDRSLDEFAQQYRGQGIVGEGRIPVVIAAATKFLGDLYHLCPPPGNVALQFTVLAHLTGDLFHSF